MSLSRAGCSSRPILSPGQALVPQDRITPIRIRYYTLRLAKSDVFTPKLWEAKWLVDQYMAFIRSEEELTSVQTGANCLSGKLSGREADWVFGYSKTGTLGKKLGLSQQEEQQEYGTPGTVT